MSRRILLIILLFSISGAPAVYAQAPDPAEIQSLVDDGNRLFGEGAFLEALEKYQRAYELSGAHGLLYMIGRSYERLGMLKKALEAFRTFVSNPDVPDGPRGKAEMAISVLEERLSTGRLAIQVEPFGAEVFVDGEPKGTAPIDPLTVDAGPHEVVARAPGRVEVRRKVAVPGGGELTVALELPMVETDTPPEEEEGPSYSPWTWVTLGTGIALAGAGAAVFVLGGMDHQEVEDALGKGTMRYSKAQDLQESGDAKRTAGVVLLGVGGAALTTMAVLFILEATGEPGDSSVSVGMTPSQDGGFFAVQGRF